MPQRYRKVNKSGPTPAHMPHLGPCWVWTGSDDGRGYGSIRAAGRGSPLLKAHRVSWELHRGDVPSKLLVLHQCDHPPCVNPDHLFLGTLSDNTQDALSKGRLVQQFAPERLPHGERHVDAKLSLLKVDAIRCLRSAGWTQTAIAKLFDVSQAAVWYVLHGRTWKGTPKARELVITKSGGAVQANPELFT